MEHNVLMVDVIVSQHGIHVLLINNVNIDNNVI